MNYIQILIEDNQTIREAIDWCFQNIDYFEPNNVDYLYDTNVWLNYPHKFAILNDANINEWSTIETKQQRNRIIFFHKFLKNHDPYGPIYFIFDLDYIDKNTVILFKTMFC